MKLNATTWALVLAFAATAVAKPGDSKSVLKGTVKEIKAAVGKSDATAVSAAFARAEKIRGDYNSKQFAPVVKAIGAAVTHKDRAIATAAIETLGRLKETGSGKFLGKLLAPPAKVAEDKIVLHQAAIAAAGSIHDPQSLKPLEKLLLHSNADLAVAGAEALAGYKALEEKPRMALAKRLVKALQGLERKAASKDEDVKARAERVKGALVSALSKLTGIEGPATAATWSKRLKEEAKKS